MNIQTAGQQKYYDFIEERAKKLRTGMIVWGSLLAVAFIGMFSDAGIAAVLALIGGAYAMVNIKAQRALKGKLDVVADPEEFFRQLADPDLTTFTIERDRKYMLPMLKDAMAMTVEPFRVLLSPWSPPKQWKTPPAKPKMMPPSMAPEPLWPPLCRKWIMALRQDATEEV